MSGSPQKNITCSIRKPTLDGKSMYVIDELCRERRNNTTLKGGSMVLSPRSYKALRKLESTNSRVTIVSFNGNLCTTVMSCDNPTNGSNEDEVLDFYLHLLN